MQIIAGMHRHQKLHVPKSPHIRPTSSYLRECLFNICQGSIQGALFLDLFAGVGAMGLEALSRGAESAVFVDHHRLSISAIKQNIKQLNEEKRSEVIFLDVLDALKLLKRKERTFDLIYADPPYAQFTEHQNQSLALSDHVLHFIDQMALLKEGGMLFLEDDKSATIQAPLTTLRLKSERTIGHSQLRQYEKI